MCMDGQQVCGRWMLGHSEYFWEKMAKMDEFGNSLKFDYPDYSWASIKLFLDCLHLIPAGPVDVGILVEVVGFCQFEGKTMYDSFEVDLVQRIMTSLMKTSLPLGTELLISAYLAKVDNFNEEYQQKVAQKLTEENVSSLLFKFDPEAELNKRLISMCSRKGVFDDQSQKNVLITLMMYGKELLEFRAGNLEPVESAVENLKIGDKTKAVIENIQTTDNYRPDIGSVRY